MTITEWASVVATLEVDSDAGRQRAVDVLKAQYQRDFLDSFVLAARAVPAILPLVASDTVAGTFASETMKRCDPRGHLGSADQEGRPYGLTRRELEVWGLISEGCTNAEIARRLFISHSTAKVHVHNILKKLGATNRLEAALAFSFKR